MMMKKILVLVLKQEDAMTMRVNLKRNPISDNDHNNLPIIFHLRTVLSSFFGINMLFADPMSDILLICLMWLE
jgi:hypothetical protein